MSKVMQLMLAFLAILVISLFMTIDLKGNLQIALELRTVRLVSIIQVAVAIALSTVVFQTISNNRILTPSIMGMDALYILLQIVLIFMLGGLGFIALNPIIKFHSNADRIIALKSGSVVANGNTDDVIKSSTLESVFGFPIEVAQINDKTVGLYF